MPKEKIYCFDFDGTITNKDTLLEFIRYARGNAKFFWGFLLFSPLLVLMKLHLYPNYRAKQQLFSWYFKGMTEDEFNELCRHFARDNQDLLRQPAISRLKQIDNAGDRILVVSASIDNWVRPFFDDLELQHVTVVGTQIEISDGRVTGRFLTHNCYGPEKVYRIAALLDKGRNLYDITAFGDSRGDKELLAYADHSFYKPFRR
ncbi:HAD-IB family hydrolase [Prevotella sp. AGR2160]|uniref:HAD-IB family hydrolase n=1 Tax=Prevotella sp. AGR2160 TaxID=1280674 RepID=UPI00041A45C8|nr:HAD-IB family hydrolase [Prevotella sp. AGR2160]